MTAKRMFSGATVSMVAAMWPPLERSKMMLVPLSNDGWVNNCSVGAGYQYGAVPCGNKQE